MRTLTLAVALLAATPALADPMMLRMVAGGTGVATQPLARGYAICLLGAGTVAGVETALANAGLTATRADQPDMGLVEFVPEGVPFAISLYDDGLICDVTSETLGTDQATMGMVIIGGMVGFQMENGLACAGMRLGGTVVAEISSSGNDPECSHPSTSNVRFTFRGADPAPAAPAAPPLTK